VVEEGEARTDIHGAHSGHILAQHLHRNVIKMLEIV